MHNKNTELETRREREKKRLQVLKDRQPKDDKGLPSTGVLLSDAIKECCYSFGLITPLKEDNLMPANYRLTVGDEYAINGELKQLTDEPGKNELVIPPFAVAIIKTRETINMPKFLIGRWNIQVKHAYEGLVWVGGPQVDAGYVGYLACPIYNLSDNSVTLKWGESIAVIDFVKTTDFHEKQSKLYKEGNLPDKILFEEYPRFKSGLVEQVQKRIDEFSDRLAGAEKEIKASQSRSDNFMLLTFGAVSVLVAALTIFVTRGERLTWWSPSLFLMAALVLFMSMTAWWRAGKESPRLGWFVQTIFALLLLSAFVSHFFWSRYERWEEIQDLRQQIKGLRDGTSLRQPFSTAPPAASQAPTAEAAPTGTKSANPAPSQKKK